MESLPCRFSSIDLFDETGTKRLNITHNLAKIRVSSVDGHVLSAAEQTDPVEARARRPGQMTNACRITR